MTYLPISVLIPTMNRPDTLRDTLDSYMQAEYLPTQIVIVDQSEDQEMQEENKGIIKSYSLETRIEYFYQEIPSSTKARNTAIKLATEEILVFSDDDINIYLDTLNKVYSLMKDNNIAMTAGINDMEKSSDSRIGYLLGTKSFSKRKIGHVTASMLGRYPRKIEGQVETQWAMGYFFVVRKSLILNWNIRWDENLTSYAYAEDLDFSYSYYKNAHAQGMRCILDKNVHVKHMSSQEYRIPSKKHTYMYVINRAYLSKKHHMGLRSAIAMRWCNFWMLMMRIVKKENPKDMWSAMKIVEKHKKEIANGNLSELYNI